MAHKFHPSGMERLLDPARREWHNPETILGHLQLTGGQRLLEVGCGPGFFTLEAARRVAPDGKVYAVDVVEAMLERLRQRAQSAGLDPVVVPVLAEEEDEYPVHSATCDAALLVNVYHEVDPASAFLNEVRRILRPGARLLVVDWKPEATPVGPPVSERLEPEEIIEEMSQSGYGFDGHRAVGPYSYGLLFHRI